MFFTSSNNYTFTTGGFGITLNALGNDATGRNYTQCYTVSGAKLYVYVNEPKLGVQILRRVLSGEAVDMPDTLLDTVYARDYDILCYPTHFTTNAQVYVYAAIPRSASADQTAMIVYPTQKIDLFGRIENVGADGKAYEQQVGDPDYYYIDLGGIISAADAHERQWVKGIEQGAINGYIVGDAAAGTRSNGQLSKEDLDREIKELREFVESNNFFERYSMGDPYPETVTDPETGEKTEKLEHVKDQDGNYLYYTNEEKKEQTTTVTDFPVMAPVMNENTAIRLKPKFRGLFSEGFMSAYGFNPGGTSGSGGADGMGSGASYDRLDRWEDYTPEKAGWVLSAALGYELSTRDVSITKDKIKSTLGISDWALKAALDFNDLPKMYWANIEVSSNQAYDTVPEFRFIDFYGHDGTRSGYVGRAATDFSRMYFVAEKDHIQIDAPEDKMIMLTIANSHRVWVDNNGLNISNGTDNVLLAVDKDGHLCVDKGLYSKSFVSAYGLNGEGGSGSGVSVSPSSWTTTEVFTSSLALASNLGWDLHSRVLSLEGKVKPSYSWSEITDKPTSMPASDVYAWAKAPNPPTHGLVNNLIGIQSASEGSGWSVVGADTWGNVLIACRNQSTAAEWLLGNFSSSLVFGGADTRGAISIAYDDLHVKFCGGNLSQSSMWYFTIYGKHGDSYDLDDIADGRTAFDWGNHADAGYAYFKDLGSAASHNHSDYLTSLGLSGNNLVFDKGGVTQDGITIPYATSASKLTTVSKTAWGQTYWSSEGVPLEISGTLSNVQSILGYGNIEMDGYIQARGAVDAGSFLYVRGNDGDYPRILFDDSSKWLRYNRDANCLETNVGIVSHSFISAYGINNNGGSSGGGATTTEKTETATTNVAYCVRSGIFLTKGKKYKIYYKAQSAFTSSVPTYTGMVLYTLSGTLDNGLDHKVINNVSEAQMQSGVTFEYTAEFDGELAPFVGDTSKSVNVDIEITYTETVSSGGSSGTETVERTETATTNVVYCTRSGIILTQGKRYRIYYKALSSFTSGLSSYTGMVLYTISGTLPTGLDHKVINNVSEAQMQSGVTFDYVAEFDGELAPFTGDGSKTVDVDIKITYAETVGSGGSSSVSKWKGKNWLSYGDSITEFGYLDPINYQQYVKPAVEFKNSYSRGIGGSSVSFLGGGGPVRFINADGSLNYTLTPNNVDYDNFAETAPSGTTKIRSAFCAWSRIKAMIPDSIRNNIDIITVMGGTNDLDYWAQYGGFSTDIPVWISGNRADPEWAADAQYYNGGDYNIGTFAGAFASTIMKLQARCPNAMIVVLTPYGWWDTNTKMQHDHDTNNPVSVRITMSDISNLEKKIAQYLAIEVIDVNAKTGINGFNYAKYKRDSVHPNDLGQRAIARAIVEGLNVINPN